MNETNEVVVKIKTVTLKAKIEVIDIILDRIEETIMVEKISEAYFRTVEVVVFAVRLIIH